MRKPYTFWFIVFYVGLILLQIFPYTGLFLMFGMALAGPIVWGLIPHLLTVVILLDAFSGRLPRYLVILPILAYSAYYTAYISEGFMIKTLAADLKSQNPSHIMTFDPSLHSLVMIGAQSLYPYSKIPVVFEPSENFPEKYLSYRMVNNQKSQEFAKLKMEWHNAIPLRIYKSDKAWLSTSLNQSMIRMPEKPDKNIIEISLKEVEPERSRSYLGPFRTSKWGPTNEGTKTIHTFKYDKKNIGDFVSYKISRMPAFPLIIVGCGLNSGAASWDCFAGFDRKTINLDTFPDTVNLAQYGANPVNAMLKIEVYQNDDFSSFHDYPENLAIVERLVEEKNSERPEDFNKWGIKKNSPYAAKIGRIGEMDSFEGLVVGGNKAGEFYDFIKDHKGETVYLQIDTQDKERRSMLLNAGVCMARENCSIRTDDIYKFFTQNGEAYVPSEAGKFHGVFMVGAPTPFINEYNAQDNDTITNLVFIRANPLDVSELQ